MSLDKLVPGSSFLKPDLFLLNSSTMICYLMIYQVEGSNATQVRLTGLSLASTGRYRCEVSAEAPSFQTVSDHGDMMTIGEFQLSSRILVATFGEAKLISISRTIKVLLTVYLILTTYMGQRPFWRTYRKEAER